MRRFFAHRPRDFVVADVRHSRGGEQMHQHLQKIQNLISAQKKQVRQRFAIGSDVHLAAHRLGAKVPSRLGKFYSPRAKSLFLPQIDTPKSKMCAIMGSYGKLTP